MFYHFSLTLGGISWYVSVIQANASNNFSPLVYNCVPCSAIYKLVTLDKSAYKSNVGVVIFCV